MAFEPSARTRKNHAHAAAKLLDPSTIQVDLLQARAHARLGPGSLVGIAAFGVIFLVGLALGYFVLPGGLLLVYVAFSVFPPRSVVVAQQGVAVLARSWLSGRPTKVVALLTHQQLMQVQAQAKGSKAEMQFGEDRLTFSKGEWARFSAAVQQVQAGWPSSGTDGVAGYATGVAPPNATQF